MDMNLKNKVKERDSNFELCRLLCMLYIVMGHLLANTTLISCDDALSKGLRSIFHVGVPVFIMISGYYGINRKTKGFLNIMLLSSFYITCGIIVSLVGEGKIFAIKDTLSVLFPFSMGKYWFISTYIALFLFSPYINKIMEILSQREHLLLLLTLAFVVFFQGGILSNGLGGGKGILTFCLAYTLGRYIKMYSRCDFSFKKILFCYILLSTVFLLTVVFAPIILAKPINKLFMGYNEIGLYLMAFIFFLMFRNLKFKSTIVNKMASSVFAIYLIHCNDNICCYVYQEFDYLGQYFDASSFWIYLIVYGVIICFVCIMIDFFRKLLFCFIKVEKIIEYISIKWNMLLKKAMIRIS